ncbi:NADP-dependent oxidoreductase [Acidipropionibacterium acidipropionici]|uniref:Zinc-binding dehydrogenase n=1 Tax=Acidipropionibacterium acidipropionici TaxID=1748 RepID=A0AAC8YGU3_9ACTN|nr:NADP-dependent oxidoreductase [Acidipropionibacterium acidipropionici]AMS06165.1 zinc-binding dehydrogenase [Acidipropionibacterium acidipropionici]AOZ47626.1 zinc-binding dehydrogenase [Acidipropionibacterium acidipropionici]AZP39051.1 NADP-dependent oxidoreductase [Acidipropionibacterium acidipropionici]
MTRRVVFSEFGDFSRLRVEDGEEIHAGPDRVRVRVAYAGLNPVELKILAGGQFMRPGLPSGNGNDFSGVIDEIGHGVEGFAVGDPVLGGRRFFAQADHVLVDPDTLTRVPAGLGLDVAGGLSIAATTAIAAIRAISPTTADTVFVSGAAGGVGVLAAQFARAAGARVIGSAGPGNHDFLRGIGIEPVSYGDGLWDRLRTVAPDGVDAALATRDIDEVKGLIALGVPADRIDSIAAGHSAADLGARIDGAAEARPDDLAHVAQAIAQGSIVVPIDSVYGLDDVASAYQHLDGGHLRGKILLRTATAADAGPLLDL